MKTLKELNEKCTLLTEYKQNAFTVSGFEECSLFNRNPTTCKLFTDNKGKYYIYEHILETYIREYTDKYEAVERFKRFVENSSI